MSFSLTSMREEASELRGPQGSRPRHFARTTSQSVAKGVSVIPVRSFQGHAIDGQLIVRTCQEGLAGRVLHDIAAVASP